MYERKTHFKVAKELRKKPIGDDGLERDNKTKREKKRKKLKGKKV